MILITGCARSGTSLTTQILQSLGVYIGEAKDVNSLYEHVPVREKVTKPYLEAIGADPLGQRPLPPVETVEVNRPHDLRARVLDLMGHPTEPWGYKDAKMCLYWQWWADAFPEAKWVIVRRDADKIAESCVRTGFMRAYEGVNGWLKWVGEHERRFEAMRENLDVTELWPDDYILNPALFEAGCGKMGLEYREGAVERAYNAGKWHERKP